LSTLVAAVLTTVATMNVTSVPAAAHHGTWSKALAIDPNNSNNLGSRANASQGANILVARFLNRTRNVWGNSTCESSIGSCYSTTSIYVYTAVGHQYFRSGCGRAGDHYYTGGDDDLACTFNWALQGGSGLYATRAN
jgi:hypothetical protein